MKWLSDGAVARLRDVVQAPDLAGTRYELVRELGRGGMGVVYEVRDRDLDRPVAMKVVAAELEDVAAARAVREARIVASLDHPGIVPIHESGRLADGRYYYTMKLVRGVRLDEWTRAGHSMVERLRIFARICEPMAFAHARGVVHRDVKPENVMIGEFGAVLVMDWGVASAGGESEELIVGTPGYMAPEQQHGAAADTRADVHALGGVLSFLLRDQGVPRAVAAIRDRAMAAAPSDRYGDAAELQRDVIRFLDGERVLAHHENAFEKAGRWLARNRVPVALVAAYIVMRVIVWFWMKL